MSNPDLAAKIAAVEALRPTLGDAPVDAAITALRAEGESAAPLSQPTVHQEATASTINNLRQVVAEHYHEATDDARMNAERALADYLRSLQHSCGTLQLGRLDHIGSVSRRTMTRWHCAWRARSTGTRRCG